MLRTSLSANEEKDASTIETEIAHITSLGVAELRLRWQETFKKNVPAALTKDLLARMICWRIQEEAFGGLDRATLKILDSYARGKPVEPSHHRRLKPGTVLVREYQGTRHDVSVSADGYLWQGETYTSLTTIARAITGSKWNGPRFFGLREKGRARVPRQDGKPSEALRAADRGKDPPLANNPAPARTLEVQL